MSWISNFIARVSAATRQARAAMSEALLPPQRGGTSGTLQETLTLSSAYRAIQILTTAAGQLPLTVQRGGENMERLPDVIRKPHQTMDTAQFIEQCTLSLVATGDLFLLRTPGNFLEILPANQVTIRTTPTGKISYHIGDLSYTTADVNHQSLMRLPGADRGLSPIAAARLDIKSALDTRNFASNWFNGSGQPTGILYSDQKITTEQAQDYVKAWNKGPTAENAAGIKTLGNGLKYTPLWINPSDAQWLESQQFSTLQIARLFGVPGSLMLAAPEGNAQSYSNVEQEWIAFSRFTLMTYLVKIEAALTWATANGQKVKFNLDALLRSDTLSRYQAYQIGLAAGFITIDEVRKREDLPTLTIEPAKDMTNGPN